MQVGMFREEISSMSDLGQMPSQRGDRLGKLAGRSLDTLESLLQDGEVPLRERVAIALKILELAGKNPPQSPPKDSQFLPGRFVRIENFLSPAENREILELAIANRGQFVASTTTGDVANYRESSILHATHFPDYYQFFKGRILHALPTVLSKLNHPPFPVDQVQMQLTAHHDGGYYKIHNDASSAKTKTRTITYVYYFHRYPKTFSGGELQLYDTEWRNGSASAGERSTIIEPRNNSIVFFNSRCQHQVMPIRCPSGQFEDGRFTLNGWLRRTIDN